MLNPWTPRTAERGTPADAAVRAVAPSRSRAASNLGTDAECCNWVLSSLELRLGLLVRELAADAAEALWRDHFPAH